MVSGLHHAKMSVALRGSANCAVPVAVDVDVDVGIVPPHSHTDGSKTEMNSNTAYADQCIMISTSSFFF